MSQKVVEQAPTTGDEQPDQPRRWTSWLVGAGPLLALAAVMVIFGAINPRFLSVANILGIAENAAILIVLAVGMTFVILLGGIDLSLEGVMATSSLVVVLLAVNDRNELDFGLWAVLAGVLVGATFGLVNGIVNTVFKVPSFMVTLGTGAIGLGVATVLFAGRAPRMLDMNLRSFGLDRWNGISKLILVALVVFAIGVIIQQLTKLGRYAYVIGGDEGIAKYSGINIRLYKTLTFVLSGALFGLAGAMAATRLGVGDVQIGAGMAFQAIAAVVIGGTLLSGGRGGVFKTLIGTLIIASLANGLILAGVPPHVQISVQGVVIVVAVAAAGWQLRERVRVIK